MTDSINPDKTGGEDAASSAGRAARPSLRHRNLSRSAKTGTGASSPSSASSSSARTGKAAGTKAGAKPKAAAPKPSFEKTAPVAAANAAPEPMSAETEADEAALNPMPAVSTRRTVSAAEHDKALTDKILLSRLASERSGDAERLSAIPDATPDNPAPWLTRRGEAAGLPSLGVTGCPPPLSGHGEPSAAAAPDAEPAPETSADAKRPSECSSAVSGAAGRPVRKASSADSMPPAGSAAVQNAASAGRGRRSRRNASPSASALSSLVSSAETGLSPSETPADSTAESLTAEPIASSSDESEDTSGEASFEERGEDGLYPVVRLTGRRSRLPEPEESEKAPEPVFNLEDERNVDIMLAKTSVRAIAARQQAKRQEIEARLAEEAMARQAEARAAMTEKQRRNADCERRLHLNTVRQAAEEHAAMIRRESVPMPESVSAVLDDPAAAADYARRMHEWESALIAEEDERLRLDAPRRRHSVPPREPLPAGTDSTLGGFPSPEPLREWTPDAKSAARPTGGMPARLASLFSPSEMLRRWQGLDRLLQAGLAVLGVAAVATCASWVTARTVVPELTLLSTPIAVTAVVADDELRDLMMLAGLLEARGIPSGRTAPLIGRSYLPAELREKLTDDTPETRLSLPLSDELLRAALLECADETGTPVLSRRTVLALPAESFAQGAALDVTARVAERLGLSGISAAAARQAVEAGLTPGAAAPDMRLSPASTAELFSSTRK